MKYTHWFEILDPRFQHLVLPNVHVDHLYSGGRWLEGPVYVPAARHLLFSDIPNNRVLRYNECDDTVSEFMRPSNFANGHTLDPEGRVVACEHQTRCVVRFEHDGSRSILADRFMGQRLNSPNDVVVDNKGYIWFTDPTYGISTEYEGARSESEIGSRNVFRLDPDCSLRAVITYLEQPNGLAITPDGKTLFVVDSGTTPARLMSFALTTDRTPINGRVLRTCDPGMYDGFRLDQEGNIWTSAGDGVHCISAEGDLLGKILIPETVSNVCFGGPAGNRLFITATRSLFAVYLNTASPRSAPTDLSQPSEVH
ncbi:SMP-30/gluconolactonase/LRE family protein [Ochrobactrum soli]|uniref:SMP-30/gluconolactonase/LRE family protein n=1 Tax=Ochrobactrum soli TaxID=2448455 RepID=A0A849KWN2_9HYPH|nr:SMP-30/gluconolactonase/LRE family protein [[Ochrobactrum] soli]NNU62808.1 SMP-30/gluconolactonase/LRE family protein [[Ochrobactrum] soli]